MTYAYIEQSNSNGQWYVRPITRGFPQGMTRSEADQIAGALNTAYNTGREGLRSDLRDLLGVKESDI